MESELTRLEEMLRFERQLKAHGLARIAGVDEAGRGPLAGPVYAAICILPENVFFRGLNDSKQLFEEDRERLFLEITSHPDVAFGIGSADAAEIDRFNILKATFLAMHRALQELKQKPDAILIDGNLAPSFGIPTIPIVKGDALSASIAAASILAKVSRDRLMVVLDEKYPQYGFCSHKGYATPEHLSAIQLYGPCAIHRKTFDPIKSLQDPAGQMDLF